MEVILLETIVNLGELGDKVNVKPGYGRNYLLPQKKAVPATKENVEIFEARKVELQALEQEKLAAAQKRAEELGALAITITAKAGEEGKLFGSIGVRDITDAVTARDIELEKSEVKLPEGPIRELGDYEIGIQLHPEVDTAIKLSVIAEQ